MQLKRAILICAVGLSVAGIFGASALRGTTWGRMMRTETGAHQLVHIFTFGILTALFMCLAKTNGMRVGLLGSSFLIAYLAEYIEHIQGKFPIELADVVTDMMGAILGATLACLLLARLWRSPRGSRAGRSEVAAPREQCGIQSLGSERT